MVRRLVWGGLVLCLGLLLSEPGHAAPRRTDPGSLLYEPSFRAGAPEDVLVAGPPVLRRRHVDAFVDLFEAAFDLALSEGMAQDLRDELEREYGAAPAEARTAWLALSKDAPAIRVAAHARKHAAVRSGLRAFRRALDARMTAAPERPLHRLLALALERRYQPMWPGKPPVAAGPAEAYLDAVAFVVGLGRGTRFSLKVTQRLRMLEALRTTLFAQPEAVRRRLARMHRIWLAAKAAWDGGGEALRFRARWSAVLLLRRGLPKAVRPKTPPGATLASYAAAAAQVREAVGGYDAFRQAVGNPAAVLVVLEQGLSLMLRSDDTSLAYR